MIDIAGRSLNKADDSDNRRDPDNQPSQNKQRFAFTPNQVFQ